MESILTLDRLRQSVAVKELLQAQGQPLMRKTASVPNFTQMLSRFDSSSLSDFQVCRSESVSELCNSSGEEPPPSKQYGIGEFEYELKKKKKSNLFQHDLLNFVREPFIYLFIFYLKKKKRNYFFFLG